MAEFKREYLDINNPLETTQCQPTLATEIEGLTDAVLDAAASASLPYHKMRYSFRTWGTNGEDDASDRHPPYSQELDPLKPLMDLGLFNHQGCVTPFWPKTDISLQQLMEATEITRQRLAQTEGPGPQKADMWSQINAGIDQCRALVKAAHTKSVTS